MQDDWETELTESTNQSATPDDNEDEDDISPDIPTMKIQDVAVQIKSIEQLRLQTNLSARFLEAVSVAQDEIESVILDNCTRAKQTTMDAFLHRQ